ncbi:MAG: hypothetical protein AB1659_08200, partial [Thermodesulfobacteriota bacterium]
MNYKEFLSHLEKTDPSSLPSVFLIHGDPFFQKKALEALLEKLHDPGGPTSLRYSYEGIDGVSGNIREAVSGLNTYSLFSGRKIVAILDSPLFISKGKDDRTIQKAKSAFDENDLKRAAGHLLGWIAANRFSLEAIRDEKNRETIFDEFFSSKDMRWVETLVDYCKENELKIPEHESDGKVLEEAVQKGFPGENRLVITAES